MTPYLTISPPIQIAFAREHEFSRDSFQGYIKDPYLK